MSSETTMVAGQCRLQEWAAQIRECQRRPAGMLNDATCFKAVYIVCGYTDLRSGTDRPAALIEAQTGNRPYAADTFYLFCGRRTGRIRGLAWEGDGWLPPYKRLSESHFQWLRSPREVRSLTPQQFRLLMEGLTIAP